MYLFEVLIIIIMVMNFEQYSFSRPESDSELYFQVCSLRLWLAADTTTIIIIKASINVLLCCIVILDILLCYLPPLCHVRYYILNITSSTLLPPSFLPSSLPFLLPFLCLRVKLNYHYHYYLWGWRNVSSYSYYYYYYCISC